MSNAISDEDSHILGGLLKTAFENEVLVLENFNRYLPWNEVVLKYALVPLHHYSQGNMKFLPIPKK